MTPERERLIHAYWREARGLWPAGESQMRVPIRRPFRPPLSREEAERPVPVDMGEFTLTYRRADAWIDGRPGYMIACEGVVVSEGRL